MPRSPIRQRGMIFLTLLMHLVLIQACSPRKNVTVIKLGHGLDTTHPVHQAMTFMARLLKEKSGGTMRIDIYPGQQLGTERECLELLQIGSLGMTKVSSSVLECFAPIFQVFGLPFLFRDESHKFSVFEGAIGRDLLHELEKYRLRGLCYYDAGSRSFYTKEQNIRRPEDLIGLKIRTQESACAIRIVNALGGSATPISWGELYTALQQGIVDGAENNPPSFYTSRHYEICTFYSLDEHTAVPDVLLVSTTIWRALTTRQRDWLQEAADESAQYQKKIWRKATVEALAAVRRAGVLVSYPDKKPFRERVQPLYERYSRNPEMKLLIEQITAVR